MKHTLLILLVSVIASSCATGGYCKHWNNPSAQDLEQVDESTLPDQLS